MSRRTERYHQDEDLNIFQAFTDLMSNAFMIISFLLLISLLQSISIAKKLESASPIIIDEKSGNFKFPSGSAELTPDLKKYIQTTILPAVKQATKAGNIDFIQAIGHTDSEGISNASNLDSRLSSVATGTENNNVLKAGSNADLGLMRAVAVIQFLKTAPGLEKVKFRAYSAAQLYLPSGKLAPIDGGADDTRRRIEIRFIPHGQKK
jgi:outer membrane protein OmpA-like peptidoglycan-associated protein